jgi:predicted DNA-binding transcriptional regulator AlpA
MSTEPAATGGAARAAAILAAAGAPDALAELPTHTPDAGRAGRADAVASQLVAMAEQTYRVTQGGDGKAYAVERAGPMIALPMRGRDGLRARLARRYYTEHRATPAGAALTDALTVLEGAAAETDPEPVALRVAATAAGALVLDLGTADGRTVVTDLTGWTVEPRAPVLFRRSALTAPLPTPRRGGDLDVLRRLVNVSDPGWQLLVGWLVAALIPDIPHPILALTGEQGTAKSTAARLLVSLIDPSPAPLRSPPRDIRQWAVTASASWTVALDNVSTVPAWLSDTLCKAVTGDGIVDRALYSDDDVAVLSFRRCLLMTSIDAGQLAGDLAERLLPIDLDRLHPDQRRTDAEINAPTTRPAPPSSAHSSTSSSRSSPRSPTSTSTISPGWPTSPAPSPPSTPSPAGTPSPNTPPPPRAPPTTSSNPTPSPTPSAPTPPGAANGPAPPGNSSNSSPRTSRPAAGPAPLAPSPERSADSPQHSTPAASPSTSPNPATAVTDASSPFAERTQPPTNRPNRPNRPCNPRDLQQQLGRFHGMRGARPSDRPSNRPKREPPLTSTNTPCRTVRTVRTVTSTHRHIVEGLDMAGHAEEKLTIAEAIAELKVSRSTFYYWRQLGKAPRCVKLPNGQIRIRRKDLEAWLDSFEEVA